MLTRSRYVTFISITLACSRTRIKYYLHVQFLLIRVPGLVLAIRSATATQHTCVLYYQTRFEFHCSKSNVLLFELWQNRNLST